MLRPLLLLLALLFLAPCSGRPVAVPDASTLIHIFQRTDRLITQNSPVRQEARETVLAHFEGLLRSSGKAPKVHRGAWNQDAERGWISGIEGSRNLPVGKAGSRSHILLE